MVNKYIKDCAVNIERDYSIVINFTPHLTLDKYNKIFADISKLVEGIPIFKSKDTGICPYDNVIKISLSRYMDIQLLYWDLYAMLQRRKDISVVKTSLKKPSTGRSKKTDKE
jgi:hypothetical protein